MKIICLDGFKPEYIKYTSFLKEKINRCLHGPLETVFSFEISASFFTGFYPNKHNIFTLFEFSKKHFTPKLPNSILMFFKNLIRLIKNQRFFYKYHKIPKYALKYFKPTLNKIWHQKGVLKNKTLFDCLRENKIPFSFIQFPNIFDGKSSIYFNRSDKNTLSKIKKLKTKIQFIHLGELDPISHKYGPYSKEVINHVRFLDKELSKINDKMIIWSDHGFLKVKDVINLSSIFKELKYGKDCVYFLDSTMARFWFKNKIVKEKVINLLKKIKNGKILKNKELKKFHLPKKQDLLFICDPGYIISPNFFDGYNVPKGMHTYNPKLKEQKGFYLISFIKGRKKPAKMVDLFPTMLKIMNLPKIKCDGKSLI